ncbi:acetylxylan esterase [Candidatus Woesearchaeota archaeon]|nr:acetylxylan esterase [Candidatus Woesearchaeota archaeon]
MKIKKNHVYFAAIAVVILGVLLLYSGIFAKKIQKSGENPKPQEIEWTVDKDGYLYYPLNRGNIKFYRENYGETENLIISKIIYQSRNENIYGFLVLPKSAAELLPGVVLLPGAGVGKESELELAKNIAQLDAAVLAIDQRGVGETGGHIQNLDEDYSSFLAGKEPYQHLLVYDALRGYDLLHSAPFVDSDRIAIAGESLGGRIAVIAAAIDRNVNGVLVISSAGLDFKGGPDEKKNTFLKSIDSDHYIRLITPRKLVMIHSINDTIIPLSSAVNSFQKAQEPKQFILVNDTSCRHGYCDGMHEGIVSALDYLIQIKSKTVASVPDE